jgi:L-alanine-DL-glutamate epimerase-like enolase superfamily enzyme
MKSNRREFLRSTALIVAGAPILMGANSVDDESIKHKYSQLDQVLNQPVLKKELFSSSVIIEKLELLRLNDNFICRVISKEGAEGISVSNNMQMVSLYPIFVNRLQPYFIGKDAVELEKLLEEVYVFQSNYKLQSLALWIPLATIEFAILDMLGRIAGKSLGELIGEIHHPEIAVYQANNYRGKSAKESIKLIVENVEKTQAKAVKFKVGGRMSNSDTPPGRTEELIPLIRKTFGEEMTIYADSNGSYDLKEAIRIGNILEEYKIDFYEEPVPFDWYEETKQVADVLKIPIAGGEQEPSLRNFRWLIANDALQIVQPDIFYFGGMIRSMKVARMADSQGISCVPHISGSGLGYLYMIHFVSALPNAGKFHEFKGFNTEIPLNCSTSDLESSEGVVKVPTGSGSGIEIDSAYINNHKLVKA